MALRRARRPAPREMDDPAARLVARSRVVLLTAATVVAALAFADDTQLGLQYTLTFGALPASVALALAADKLSARICALAGAAIDVGLYVAALLAFPDAAGALALAFLIPVLVASYTGGRLVGAVADVSGIATLVAADATNHIPPAGELEVLAAVAVAVILAIVGRADARLHRSTGKARRHEERAALLLQHLATPVVVTGSTGRLIDGNDAARDLLGIPATTATRARALGLRVEGTPLDCTSGCGLLSIPGSQDAGGVEATAWPEGREPVPVLVSVVALPGVHGEGPEYLHSLRDISKLKLADEAKTLFLAATTHELKTPLTVIRGFLDTIAEPNVDEDLRLTAVGVMRKRALELSSIIERILLASRIDSGHFEVELDEVDVVALVHDRVTAMAAATARDIRLGEADAAPSVLADEASLATVVDHLLDNACKYSAAGRHRGAAPGDRAHRRAGRARSRTRHDGRRSPALLRPLLAGRLELEPARGRHGHRPVHRGVAGRGHARQRLRRVVPGVGLHVHRRPAAGRRRPDGLGERGGRGARGGARAVDRPGVHAPDRRRAHQGVLVVTATLAVLSIGSVYTSYGILTAIDLSTGWRRFGFSHFGLAWIAMAFTCGPHHLEHGIHLATGQRVAGPLELVAVVVGFPAGVIWFLLRVEAMTGGRGDRVVRSDATVMRSLPALSIFYGAVFAVALVVVVLPPERFPPMVAANLLLVVLYGMIGWYLLRTQLASHTATGRWSLSGVALTLVFPTCALMHGAWVGYQVAGLYVADVHSVVIDWFAVPAAAYFLWVVRGLHSGSVRDWNEATTGAVPVLSSV